MVTNPLEQLSRSIAKLHSDSELDITQSLVDPAKRELKRLQGLGDTTSINQLLAQNLATARGLQQQLLDTLDQLQQTANQAPEPVAEPAQPVLTTPPIDGVRPPTPIVKP